MIGSSPSQRMELYDQHLHSKHSYDSQADPVDVVRRAIEVGLTGLTFTEHYDTHPSELASSVYDDAQYGVTIEALRLEFGKSVRVGKGIEVDFQEQNMPAIVEFLDDHEFDLVILSVHWFGGRPIFRKDSWTGQDPSENTRRYLEAVLQAMRFCERLHGDRPRVFDVLGHLDFVKRYSRRYAKCDHVADHGDLIDEILRTCLAADIIPEVNTSTVRQGLGESMPGPAVMRRYAELGGTMMSIGSDSHRAEHIGADFDGELSTLRNAGIPQIAVFEDRHRRAVPIADPAD